MSSKSWGPLQPASPDSLPNVRNATSTQILVNPRLCQASSFPRDRAGRQIVAKPDLGTAHAHRRLGLLELSPGDHDWDTRLCDKVVGEGSK